MEGCAELVRRSSGEAVGSYPLAGSSPVPSAILNLKNCKNNFNAEGWQNGNAPVLKTGGRKPLEVRVLHPPPNL